MRKTDRMRTITIVLSALLIATAAKATDAPGAVDLTQGVPGDITRPKQIDGLPIGPTGDTAGGKVIVTFTVKTDGTTSDLRLAQSAEPVLNEAAVSSILGRYYRPATRAGAPIAVRIASGFEYPAIGGAEPNEKSPRHAPRRPMPPIDSLSLDCRFGTHQVAIDACNAEIAKGNKDLTQLAWFFRALAYEAVGDYRKAIEDFDALLDATPRISAYLRERGFLYERLGDYDHAVADYDHAVQFGSGIALGDLAFAYYGWKRRDWSEATFKRARGCQKMTPIARSGTLFMPTPDDTVTGQVSADPIAGECEPKGVLGLDEIPEIIAGSPSEGPGLVYRCWAKGMWNADLQKALVDCDRAIALNATDLHAFEARALIHIRLGDPNGAQQDIDKALSINPHSANALYLRGIVAANAGDVPNAASSFLASRAVDPGLAGRYILAGVIPQLGRTR